MTITYTSIIWLLVIFLGFGSTVDCGPTWQLALYCDLSYWQENFQGAPSTFFRNLFLFLFLHNGLDHILFVSIFGCFIIFQSFESHFGSFKTVVLLIGSNIIMGLYFGFFFDSCTYLYPNFEFCLHMSDRGWMGGSVSMFFLYGFLGIKSKKPLVYLAIPIIFELINLFVIEIDYQISYMHLMSCAFGFILAHLLNKRKLIR